MEIFNFRNSATEYVWATAMSQYGVEEYSVGENKRIIEYHSATDYASKTQHEAWCASFINWCLEQNGIAGTRKPNARSFLDWGSETQNPQVGDIIVMSRGTNPFNGHVGLLYPTDQNLLDQGLVMVLGGNQTNMVCVKAYSVDRVLQYRVIPELEGEVTWMMT